MAGMTTQGGALVSEASCQLPALAVRRMLRQHDCSQTRWRRLVVVKVRERQSRTSRQAWRAFVAAGPASENFASSRCLPGVKHGLAAAHPPFSTHRTPAAKQDPIAQLPLALPCYPNPDPETLTLTPTR